MFWNLSNFNSNNLLCLYFVLINFLFVSIIINIFLHWVRYIRLSNWMWYLTSMAFNGNLTFADELPHRGTMEDGPPEPWWTNNRVGFPDVVHCGSGFPNLLRTRDSWTPFRFQTLDGGRHSRTLLAMVSAASSDVSY